MNEHQPAFAITFIIASVTASVAALGVVITGSGENYWYSSLVKPAFNPPDLAFQVVWPVLFGLMALSAVVVRIKAGSYGVARPALLLYFLQLGINLAWSWLFFGFHLLGVALGTLVLLWMVVVLMIRAFARYSTTAAVLQVPYFLWISFAAYLNATILMLNAS
ncbi:MAG: tryptophan-rich sensory protein [Alphaproteobacteria bacterium]|nr:tryptophan-rich sensory protein [Alphaproteobacteria bacterium]